MRAVLGSLRGLDGDSSLELENMLTVEGQSKVAESLKCAHKAAARVEKFVARCAQVCALSEASRPGLRADGNRRPGTHIVHTGSLRRRVCRRPVGKMFLIAVH